MYNRRNFLRNGVGLAGIIAAQKCPAFVKGLVAASNSSLVGANMWTNPYVTDGLVAMYDGEWNAGGGRHEDNALFWKDISGNRQDIPLENELFFIGKNYVKPTSSSANASISANTPLNNYDYVKNGITFECVVGPASTTNGFVFWTSPNSMYQAAMSFRFNAFRPNTAAYGSVGKSQVDLSPLKGSSTFSQGISFVRYPIKENLIPYEVFQNGKSLFLRNSDIGGYNTIASLHIGKTYNYAAWEGEYYSIRVYLKALTPEEIAYNHSIDKERFGL